MAEGENEDLTVADVMRILPRRNGKEISRLTVMRWIKSGCRGVKLTAAMKGGMWFTTRNDLEQFLAACTRRGSEFRSRTTTLQMPVDLASDQAADEPDDGTIDGNENKLRRSHGRPRKSDERRDRVQRIVITIDICRE